MSHAARWISHTDLEAASLPTRAKAVIFTDPKSQLLLKQIERVSTSDAPVLIVGETGTGKELVARHIHAQSKRKGAFVAVNCGALSQSLAEAELFGHQAGSFTGANESRAGWFEAANGGTLFLDEMADLPAPLQVKLLRVLQEREVVRVGSRKPIPLDVRIVAATNVDLAQAVGERRFRLDLYYRLNVVTFDLPPLRARPRDILPLVDYFLRLYSAKLKVVPPVLEPETKRALLEYSWPGNVRELENVVHCALLTNADGVVRPRDLKFAAMPSLSPSAPDASSPLDALALQLDRLFAAAPGALFQMLEALIVGRAFAYCGNNQVQTAKLLGISRNVMRTLLKRARLIGSGADEPQLVSQEPVAAATSLEPQPLLPQRLE